MAVFKRLPPEIIKRDYTHHASLFGICPVYVNRKTKPYPRIIEANGVPRWYFMAVTRVAQLCAAIAVFILPEAEVGFVLHIKEEIKDGTRTV